MIRRWLAAALLTGLIGPAQALDLSAEERAWLDANGPVRVVVGPLNTLEWPYYRVQAGADAADAQPVVTGYAADLMALVTERTGMQIRYISAPNVPAGGAMLRSGQAQMSLFLRMAEWRRSILTMPEPILVSEMVWVVRQDAPPMDVLRRQPGLRAAVGVGTPIEEALRRAFPMVQITPSNGETSSIPPVAEGRTDIALVSIHAAIQAIERNRLPGLQIRRTPTVPPSALGPVVGLQFPLLHSIMAKALATVSPAERALLARRWLPEGVETAFGSQVATLSADESAWVASQARLRWAADGALPPLTQGDTRSDVSGLAADVLRHAVQKAGLQVGMGLGVRADRLPSMARSGEIDIAVGVTRTAANNEAYLFVGPYLRVPTVIATAVAAPHAAADLGDVGPGPLATLRNDPLLPELKSRFPALQTLEFDHQDDALQAVVQGRAVAAIGNAFTINHLIQQRHAGRVQITGVVGDGEVDLYFGVPRSQPQLAHVLNLGFAALTPSDMAALRQRWLLLRIDDGLKWTEVLRWALPVAVAMLALLGVLLVANRRLSAAHLAAEQARAQAEAATAARGRFLAYLAHEVRGLVDSIGWGARLMMGSQPHASPDQVASWIKASAESTGRLLESTLDNERSMVTGMELKPAPHDLVSWWHETLAPHELTAASKALKLQVQPPHVDALLRFDALRLRQVVHNLVGNAIKFTHEGTVSVNGSWDASTQQLSVEVLDDGPGLEPCESASLWQPYAQGHAGRQAGAGAGLGLAITRQIVSAMGGTVQGEARAQGGSRFWFQVPLESVERAD